MGIIDFRDIDPYLIRQGPYAMIGEALSYFLRLELCVKMSQNRPSGMLLPDFELSRHDHSPCSAPTRRTTGPALCLTHG
jgi:hypothetical protein